MTQKNILLGRFDGNVDLLGSRGINKVFPGYMCDDRKIIEFHRSKSLYEDNFLPETDVSHKKAQK